MTRTLNLPLALPLSWSGGGSAFTPSQGGGADAWKNAHLVGMNVYSQAQLTAQTANLGAPITVLNLFYEEGAGTSTWARNVTKATENASNYAWAAAMGLKFDHCVPGASSTQPLSETNAGLHDAEILAIAQTIAAFDKNNVIFIRLMHEANLRPTPNYAWSYNIAGGYAPFTSAFRRIAGLFRSVDPRFRFGWVLIPNTTGYDGTFDWQLGYPGDDVVDWGGADPYYIPAYDGADGGRAWLTKCQGYAGLDNMYKFFADKGKPYAFSEYGAASNDPGYYRAMAQWMLGKNIMYHNEWDQNNGALFDTRLSSYPVAGAEWYKQFGPAVAPFDTSGLGVPAGFSLIRGAPSTILRNPNNTYGVGPTAASSQRLAA